MYSKATSTSWGQILSKNVFAVGGGGHSVTVSAVESACSFLGRLWCGCSRALDLAPECAGGPSLEFCRKYEEVRQETRSAAQKMVFVQLIHPPSLVPVMSVWMLKIKKKNEDLLPPGKLQKRKPPGVLNSIDSCQLDQRHFRSTAS